MRGVAQVDQSHRKLFLVQLLFSELNQRCPGGLVHQRLKTLGHWNFNGRLWLGWCSENKNGDEEDEQFWCVFDHDLIAADWNLIV
jgi:hypothetical protein